MGSLCLSTASILRCESFTRLQDILLIIPTALEVIFSTSLIFTNWGTGRQYLWLTAEGWIYFALALFEMLTHILPAARASANVVKVLDIVLGAASFLPIFFYILFLFLFARSEFIAALPLRLQAIAKLLLIITIPAIITLNELASFIGVSHRILPVGSVSVMAIGFSNVKNQTLWTFFTSLTLALLTGYQAINFSFAFYRMVTALLEQRRIEATSSDEAHLFRGIGWITGGLKLGAIETVLGFTAGGFERSMVRRIMRFLARATLCIGLVKGLDSAEDFSHIRDELSGGHRKEFRRSRLREFISNPRFSTFRQLTPTATAFHAIPRAPLGLSQFSPQYRTPGGLPGMRQFADLKSAATIDDMSEKPSRERVTVVFEGGTPSLVLRFSALSIPPFNLSPPRPMSEWVAVSRPASPRRATYHASSPHNSLLSTLVISDSGQDISDLKSPPEIYIPTAKPPPSRIESSYSTRSFPESYTSLSAVRELTSQFPPLPARAHELPKQPPANENPAEFWDDTTSIVSRASTAKPRSSMATPVFPSSEIDPVMSENAPAPTRTSNVVVPITPSTSQSPSILTALSGYTAPTPPTQSALTLTADTEHEFPDYGSALDTGKSRTFTRDSAAVTGTDPADWIDFDAIPKGPTATMLPPVMEEGDGERRVPAVRSGSQHSRRNGSMGAPTILWLKNPEMEEHEAERRRARTVGRKGQLSRIKSIGKAPIRSTPAPVKVRHARNSVAIERIVIPPKEDSNVEIIQGSLDSAYSRNVLRDEEVLAIEDGSYARDLRQKGYF